jgi:hypothetical protein
VRADLFAQRFDDIDPDALVSALMRSLATMDRLSPDDATRIARFSAGTSATSWGQHHLAEVTGSYRQDRRSKLPRRSKVVRSSSSRA